MPGLRPRRGKSIGALGLSCSGTAENEIVGFRILGLGVRQGLGFRG